MRKIAITGPDGLIGSRITELLKNDFTFIPLLQSEFDITDKYQVEQRLNAIDFDLLLHLAAYTNVDGAEQTKDLTAKVNIEGTKSLFNVVINKNKKFIYISTDFVFDGEKPPYDEKSTPHPISYYGETKYQGEKILNNQAMIIRLSYPYRAYFDLKKDFVRSIRSHLEQGNNLQMVTDSLITPTFIDDICYGLKYLINNYSPEIYHLVGSNSLSPYDAGLTIAKLFGLNETLIQPVTYDVYFRNKAKRPKLSEIKSKKNNFYPMRSFVQGLTQIKNQLVF